MERKIIVLLLIIIVIAIVAVANGSMDFNMDIPFFGKIELKSSNSESLDESLRTIFTDSDPSDIVIATVILRELYGFYKINDPQLVKQISGLDYYSEVSEQIRNLAILREGPFDQKAMNISIIFKKNSRINPGWIGVCKSGIYARKKLKIRNSENLITVTGYSMESDYNFSCRLNRKRALELEIGIEDARRLINRETFEKFLSDKKRDLISVPGEVEISL